MALTLTEIRDHYDTNKSRYIDEAEIPKAQADYSNNIITMDELFAIIDVFDQHTLLPAYSSTVPVSLEWIRDHYDTNKSRYIDLSEFYSAEEDYRGGDLTEEQLDAVYDAYDKHTLLPAYPAPAVAKGSIVNVNYPTTATNGASISIRAAVKNTGDASGLFKLQIYKGTSRIAQSSLHTVAAGSTGTTHSMSVNLPSTGTAVSYTIKCIRVT